MVAHVRRSLTLHALAVDAQYLIASLESVTCGRHTLIRLIYINVVAAGILTDDGTYSGILAGGDHLKVHHVILRIILGIRIYAAEHSLNSLLNGLLGVDGIYIETVQLAYYLMEDLQVTGNLKVVVIGLLCRCTRTCKTQYDGQGDALDKSLHSDFCFREDRYFGYDKKKSVPISWN